MPSTYKLIPRHASLNGNSSYEIDILDEKKSTEIFADIFSTAKEDNLEQLLILLDKATSENILKIKANASLKLLRLLRDIQDENGKTPWDYLVKKSSQNVLTYLYTTITSTTSQPYTKAHFAFNFNQVEIFKKFVQDNPTILTPKTFNIDEQQAEFSLPYIATINNCPALLEFLHKNNSPKKYVFDQQLLGEAIKRGHTGLFSFFITQQYIREIGSDSPLLYAVKSNQTESVDYFLDNFFDLGIFIEALHFALENQSPLRVQLISKLASLDNLKEWNKLLNNRQVINEALVFAIQQSLPIEKNLFDLAVKLNSLKEDEKTFKIIFKHFMANGRLEEMKGLLKECNFNLHQHASFASECLFFAVQARNAALANWLISEGAVLPNGDYSALLQSTNDAGQEQLVTILENTPRLINISLSGNSSAEPHQTSVLRPYRLNGGHINVMDPSKIDELLDQVFEFSRSGNLDGLVNLLDNGLNKIFNLGGKYSQYGLIHLLHCAYDADNKRPWDYVIKNQFQHILDAAYQKANPQHESVVFTYAVQLNQIDALQYFEPFYFENGRIGTFDDENISLACAGVESNSLLLVRLLKLKGVTFGEKELKRALEKDFPEMVKFLMQECEITNLYGFSPLFFAVTHNCEDTIDYLLKNALFDADAIYDSLHSALQFKPHLVDALLTHATSKQMEDLFVSFASSGKMSILKKLLPLVNINQDDQKTALRAATQNGYIDVANWLKEEGATWTKEELLTLCQQVFDKDEPSEDQALQKFLKQEVISENCTEALSIITEYENELEINDLLLALEKEFSADKVARFTEITDKDKRSLIFIQLADAHKLEVMRAIYTTVDINHVVNGYTALGISIDKEYLDIAEWLISIGANLSEDQLIEAYAEANLKRDEKMKAFLKKQALTRGLNQARDIIHKIVEENLIEMYKLAQDDNKQQASLKNHAKNEGYTKAFAFMTDFDAKKQILSFLAAKEQQIQQPIGHLPHSLTFARTTAPHKTEEMKSNLNLSNTSGK